MAEIVPHGGHLAFPIEMSETILLPLSTWGAAAAALALTAITVVACQRHTTRSDARVCAFSILVLATMSLMTPWVLSTPEPPVERWGPAQWIATSCAVFITVYVATQYRRLSPRPYEGPTIRKGTQEDHS